MGFNIFQLMAYQYVR